MSYVRTRGLGASTSQVVGQVGGVGAPVVSAAAAPAVAAALGISASVAIPIVGAAFAGVLIGIEALLNSGCGQTCVVTSQWANQAEPQLRANIDQYFSLNPRTASDQTSALRMFDAVWAGLVQRCSQSGLGTAGQNCIADRQAGACKWHATADSPWPGGPKRGECWNWFNAYRDPIAKDTPQPDTVASSLDALIGGTSTSGSSALLPLALIGGLLLVGAAL